MDVDDKTAIIRRCVRLFKGQGRSEEYQMGELRCSDDIVFPAVVVHAGYNSGRLISAEVLSPTSITVNKPLPVATFMVAQSKGSQVLDFRHSKQEHWVTISEDVPDVVAYLVGAEKMPGNVPGAEEKARSPVAELKALRSRWNVVQVQRGKEADESFGPIFGYGPAIRPEHAFCFNFEKLLEAEGEKDALRVIRDHRIWSGGDRSDDPCVIYRIDPTASPKTIDLLTCQSPRSESHARQAEQLAGLGIYEIDGDRLKICVAQYLPSLKSDQRPKSFAVDPQSADSLFVLERHRVSADEEAIDGRWTVAAQVDDGKPASAEKLRGKECLFVDQFMGMIDNSAGSRGMPGWPWLLCVLDTAKQPKRIVLSGFESDKIGSYRRDENGNLKKRELLGIYKFEGERLTIAFRKGDAPPEKFESKPGSDVTLLVLERPEAGSQSKAGRTRQRQGPGTAGRNEEPEAVDGKPDKQSVLSEAAPGTFNEMELGFDAPLWLPSGRASIVVPASAAEGESPKPARL